MNKFYISLLFSLFLSLFSFNAKASHLAGGDFNVSCVGQDTFLVTFNFFRDCSGAGIPTSISVNFASPCGSFNATMQRDSIVEVSQLCPSALGNSTCNTGGTLPGMQQAYFSALVYIAPCAQGMWTMGYSICCRNSSNNLQGQPNFFVEAQIMSGLTPCNNLPVFNAQPIPYVCANQQVVYNFGVTEIDGDSLVFILAQPLAQATTNANFQGAYSPTNPFNVPVVLNPNTGEVTFTPTQNGMWVIKVCVLEYRNGIQIGRVCRDIQFVVQSCQNYQPFMMAPGITNFQGSGIQLDSNSVEVCIGNNFSFDIYFGDSLHPNQLPGQGDSVTLSSNIGQVLPGATVTITNGNPAIANVSWTAQPGASPFSIFIINAVDNACNIPGIASYAFDITIIPATWAGPDQYLCQGEDTAHVGVVGGDTFSWQVLQGEPFNFGVNFKDTTGTNGQNVWMFPQQTTTYRVESNLTGTCVNEDTITIFVSRNFILNTFGDTTVCPNDSFNLFQFAAIPDTSASTSPPYLFSYQWSNPASLNNDTISNPLANIFGTSTYGVTVSSDSLCIKTGQVTVTFGPYFPDTMWVQFTDTVLCLGDSTVASVNFGVNLSSNCEESSVGCGGNIVSGFSGTGFNANGPTEFWSPYTNWLFNGTRTQYLYTAAELNAMGMTGGARINSLSFFVNNTNGIQTLQNFTIRVKCTTQSAMNIGWVENTIPVYGPTSQVITTGWNQHTLTNGFDWDGTSNLVVEICYNGTATSNNSSVRFTPTPFVSVRHYRVNNSPNVCTENLLTGTSTNRANTRFNFCKDFNPSSYTYNWSPSASLSASNIHSPFAFPTSNATYTVTISDTLGLCSGIATGSINVVTAYDASFTLNSPVCVNGGIDTANSVVPGGTYSGQGINPTTGIFNPALTTPGNVPIVYTLVSPTGNCLSTDTVVVSVVPKPDATITSPLEFCKQGDPIQLTAATPGGVWSGNAGIVNPTAGIFNPQSLPVAGSYIMYYTLTTPCFSADTVTIKAYLPYNFNFIDTPKTLCVNDTSIFTNYVPLSGPNYGSGPIKYRWAGPGITNPDSGFFNPLNIGPGNYFVNLTASDTNDQCATTKQMRVQVFAIDTPSVNGDLTYCDNTFSQLVSVDRGFGNSAIWSASPLAPTTNALNISSSGTFNPQNTGAGKWLFAYSFTNNNGCVGSLIDTIIVQKSPGEPLISSPNFCSGTEMILRADSVEPDSVIWYPSILAVPGSELGFGSPFNYGTALYTGNDQRIFAQAIYGACKGPIVGYTIPVRPDAPAEFWLVFPDTTGTNPEGFDSVFVTPSGVFDKNNFPFTEKIVGLSPFSIKSVAQNLLASLGDTVQWDFWVNGTIGDQPYGWPARLPTLENIQKGEFHFPVGEYTYEKEGIYVIKMVHRNEFGCADTSFIEIDVRFQGDPPNIFTPNGDGINDVFYIPGSQGLRDFKCEIYNRWGRKIFEFTNPDPIDGGGWDGNGASDGVYFYIATGKRAGDVDYVKQGTVTLLKEKQ